jgi:hypothetical protein
LEKILLEKFSGDFTERLYRLGLESSQNSKKKLEEKIMFKKGKYKEMLLERRRYLLEELREAEYYGRDTNYWAYEINEIEYELNRLGVAY